MCTNLLVFVTLNKIPSFSSSLDLDYQEQEGTRLRHIKHKPGPKTHEGPAVYHSLPCFELTDVPPSRQAPVIGSLDPLSILDAVEIESVASEVCVLSSLYTADLNDHV